MLFSVEQVFVGRDEKWAPVKTPAWEASTDLTWKQKSSDNQQLVTLSSNKPVYIVTVKVW